MNTANGFFMVGLFAAGLASTAARAECTPGETQCGADSMVERCTDNRVWRTDPDSRCNRELPQPRDEGRRYVEHERDAVDTGRCTSGISRCGAGGMVERCTDSNMWVVEPGNTCNR